MAWQPPHSSWAILNVAQGHSDPAQATAVLFIPHQNPHKKCMLCELRVSSCLHAGGPNVHWNNKPLADCCDSDLCDFRWTLTLGRINPYLKNQKSTVCKQFGLIKANVCQSTIVNGKIYPFNMLWAGWWVPSPLTFWSVGEMKRFYAASIGISWYAVENI